MIPFVVATMVNPSIGVVADSLEKKYVEDWCSKTAARGVSAVAARWGGINPHNRYETVFLFCPLHF